MNKNNISNNNNNSNNNNMKYICKLCDYETTNKSNYNKHLKSNTHHKNNPTEGEKILDKNECSCGKLFSFPSGLSRHKKTCNGINLNEEIITLKKQVEQMSNQMSEYKDKTINNTYNISVKNYIQQNYSKAPHLKRLNHQTIMQIIDEDIDNNYEEEKNDDDDLMDKLIYNYKHNILHVYLGTLLIKYYKKAAV